ncbi:hypothetical protein EDD18DRAFT_1109968 [Armillaria luteobubalina]|uniref:Uncharacterized protein n=1 Tax=Armillaria luteobubalina TaxID=153913 RepID=A0AA39PVB6_9AGAR|nr:hypothetical protein EDD18DRAFT_1109968 [Armillaria luteobubalina]
MQRDPVISVYPSYLGSSRILSHNIYLLLSRLWPHSKLVIIMQRQRYVALGGPHAGLYDSLILPITIKAGPDNADLLADLVELFPEHARPDQMARIIERSDKVGEVSNQIKSKIYCVLDGKTAFGKVRMIFVTDNFKEVESFLNNGNTWKRETSLCKGLLYMLQNFQGAEPTPPEPNISSYRQKSSVPQTSDSRQPTSTPSSTSTTEPMPALHNGQVCQPQNQPSVSAQSALKGKGRGTFRTSESQSTRSSSKGKGRERSRTPDLDSEVDLELEERVSRLEERLNSLGL